MDEISWFELNYHLSVEPVILGEEDFLESVRSREGGIVFVVAEGFKILIDKTDALGRVLRERVTEIKRSHAS